MTSDELAARCTLATARALEAQNERAAIERRAANSVDTDCHLCGLMFSTVLGVKQHLRQTHRRAVAA